MPRGGVSVEARPGGWALLTIAAEPANTLGLDLWTALDDALSGLEADSAIRGVVICSGLRRDIFSAGNDIKELYAPLTSRERFLRFWEASQVFLARLYRSPLLTVAAIRGACPAGGCAISMCCDMRVMTKDGFIGLNEVALGIPVPIFWTELFLHLVGGCGGEKLLMSGAMLSPQQAKGTGLIDQVVETREELLPAAEAMLKKGLKLPDGGRQLTKGLIRNDLSQRWEAGWQSEAEMSWDMLDSAPTKKMLKGVLDKLRSKATAKL